MLNAILVRGRSERQHMLKYAVAVLDLKSAGRFLFFIVNRSVFHFFFLVSDYTLCCYTQERKEIHPEEGRQMGFHLTGFVGDNSES